MTDTDAPERPEAPEPVDEEETPSETDDVTRDDDQDDERSGEIETRHHAQIRQSSHGGPDTTATLQPLLDASPQDWLGSNQDPDVLISIPNLGIDHIGLTVDKVRAHVELHAKVLDLLELHVGADASVDKIELNVDNVRLQAMVKIKLEKVVDIVGRVMDLLMEHPEILSNLTRGLGAGIEAKLAEGGGEARTVQEADRMQLSNARYDSMPEEEQKPDENVEAE